MLDQKGPPLNVMIWGTYDLGKPRTRLAIQAIRASGAQVQEIHSPVWEGTEDKSVLRMGAALRRAFRWLIAYPRLVFRFVTAPRPDVVVVGYLGHLDVLLLWPFAKLRGVPVVWDAFLSLYDTVVLDRKMVSPRHPAAWFLKAWEWLACRAADRIVLDTEAQAGFFKNAYALRSTKVTSALVGAEDDFFSVAPTLDRKGRSKVLFYGQFIPLHGISTIVEAARLSRDRAIDWVIVGTGQMAASVRQSLEADPVQALDWIEWVPYPELKHHIAQADVCLGVFGESDKAGRVIPNKVFQILLAGRPLVTRDGPGIRELVAKDAEGIELVPPADPNRLLDAVDKLIESGPFSTDLHHDLRAHFSNDALASRWAHILTETTTR